jgi:hypothetical protein
MGGKELIIGYVGGVLIGKSTLLRNHIIEELIDETIIPSIDKITEPTMTITNPRIIDVVDYKTGKERRRERRAILRKINKKQ